MDHPDRRVLIEHRRFALQEVRRVRIVVVHDADVLAARELQEAIEVAERTEIRVVPVVPEPRVSALPSWR